jgi:hypothetical protein
MLYEISDSHGHEYEDDRRQSSSDCKLCLYNMRFEISVEMMAYTAWQVTLSGLVVACLPLDPRFMGSNPAKDDGFLWVIKICSTTSFGEEVKLSAPYHKFL